jgi:4-aminobutyrate aminotransferase/(S)-3-amino-2-methylpropionate transaminase
MIKTENREIRQEITFEDTDLSSKKTKFESIALSRQLVDWESAKDFSVWDTNGNKYIDMTSGIFVANAGHANPAVKAAIVDQLDKNMWFSFLYNNQMKADFIDRLLEISPPHFEKVVLLNTGSEITDIAAKLIKFWAAENNRKYTISYRGSYHGRTLAADFLCGDENSTKWSGMDDDSIKFIDFPQKGESFDPSILPNPKDIAAFFLETYQGWGALMYPKDYLRDLYSFAKSNDILICFDEIQAGFYRMGTLYGYMSYGDYIKPDLICLAKGLSSSLPMSALLGTKRIVDVHKRATVGGTHYGNPLCCAASMANINFLVDQEFQESLQEKIPLFENLSRELLKFDAVKDINTKGMVTGIIFNDEPAATRVVKSCIQAGVLPVYTHRNSIKLGPPLTITTGAIQEAMGVIRDCLEKEDAL